LAGAAGVDGAGSWRDSSDGERDYTEVTVHSPSATMYILTELDKFTRYEVSVQPFYASVSGTDSNLLRFQTAPDSQSRRSSVETVCQALTSTFSVG